MSDKPIKLAINGAAGRMGQRLIALSGESVEFQVVAALEAPGHPAVGREIDGVTVTDRLGDGADVVIDFSLPAGTRAVVPQAVRVGAAMVIGTTGLASAQQSMIEEAARSIPIVQASNTSLGINLLLKLAAEAAAALGAQYDTEIVELHHRFKKDAPSGTAMSLAKSICEAMGKDIATSLKHGRSGDDPRQAGEIGMHAVRLGDVVGQHTVYFTTLGETITLAHAAHTRDTFVTGALRAAAWVFGKPPGKYGMDDVLFGGK